MSGRISVNTSFSGEHAIFIEKLEKMYNCSKPMAIRRFLGQFIEGKLVVLDANTRDRIEFVIENPILRTKFGIKNKEGFVDYAIQLLLNKMEENLHDLRDPIVQALLDENEIELAKLFVMNSKNPKYYGGMNLSEIIELTGFNEKDIIKIINKFIQNRWILKTTQRKYIVSNK